MSGPFTYLTLSNGSGTWRLATAYDNQDASSRNNMLVFGSDRLLTFGENDSEAVERTYSDGSVLPPNPRYAGREFSIDVLIFSLNRKSVNVKTIMSNFITFLRSGTMTLSTDFPHSLTVQVQRVDLVAQDWKGTARVQLKIFFKAAQA